MKKIFATLFLLAPISTFAAPTVLDKTGSTSVAKPAEEELQKNKDTIIEPVPDQQPKAWYKNWQIGLGVPLIPTGYNGFIGYVNKNSSSFWWKRLGARLDFQIPSDMDAKFSLSDNGTEYDVSGKANILFLSKSFDDVATFDYPTFDDDSDNSTPETKLNLDGANGKFALSNQNIGALIDFYPFGNTWFFGGIRLTGGYYFGDMKAKINVNLPNDLPTDGGWSYKIDNTATSDTIVAKVRGGSKLSAKFNWNYSGPYAGFGFDLGIFRGFKFYMDTGVVFAKPPKVNRSRDISMPELTACYQIYGQTECGNAIILSLNQKPNVDDWIKGITAELINAKVNGTVDTIDPATKDAIAVAILGPGSTGSDLAEYDFNLVATDLLNYVDGTTDASTAAPWIQEIFNATSDTQSDEIENALNDVRAEWTNINDADNPDSFQHQIDSAWNDYEKGINDLNDSLKDMKWMPVVKLGFLYRF